MTATTTKEPLHLHKSTLENGSLLIHKHLPEAPRLALYLFLPGGNTLDPTPGMADLIDRLVMKGTPKRDQEALAQALDSLTLEVDVETRRDMTIIGGTLLEEDLDASLELISDFFYNANFKEFDREKQKIVGELQMELDSHRAKASDLMLRAVFGETRYGTTSSVFLDNIDKLNSVETALNHYHQVYQPNQMVVSLAGAISETVIADKINQYFPKTTHTVAALNDSVIHTLKNHKIAENQYVTGARDDSAQCHIYQAWLAPTLDNDDFYPMVVLNTLLGAAGLSSRLFLELRDKQGLAYTVRSSYDAYRYNGLFNLYIGTDPANKQKCLDGFKTECQKLMDTPVSAKELADTKVNILGRRAVYLETASQQASYYGSNFVMGRDIADLENLPDAINGVTAAQIQHVAQKYLTQPSVVSVVGPSAIL